MTTSQHNRGENGYGNEQPNPALGRQPEEHVRLRSLVGLRVVICEDEPVTQLQLRRILARGHCIVVGSATNGQEAVDMVLREKPDLVLMDIEMPTMSGLEAARRILEVYPVCIVMLTAYAEESYQEQAYGFGASGYIVKPIMGDALLPELEQAYSAFRQRP